LQSFLGTVVIKDKVVCGILQSPGIKTLQSICQQPVLLTGNPTGCDAQRYLLCPQYWITALLSSSERQRRKATPVDSVADEAMGYSFGQEDPSTKNGRPTLMMKGLSLYRDKPKVREAWAAIVRGNCRTLGQYLGVQKMGWA